jgi:DivIVA domain-containing protein
MVDLASIRNASFTLTPTGYNPEEVDQFLADLADQLSEMPVAEAPQPVITQIPIEQPQAVEPTFSEPTDRPSADLEGLQNAVERTISAMDAFVQNELAEVKAASALEIEEIHRERERLLEEAGEAAKSHLDEARVRGEHIVHEAQGQGEELRVALEAELQAERERFEQALADRDAQAQARVAEVLAEAEEHKREAEQLVADANKVQSQVLGAIEQARASLALPEPVQNADEQFSAEQSFVEDQEPEAEVDAEYEVEVEAETETEAEVVTETDEEPTDQTEDQSDDQPAEVDVFGFERQQGTSLRSIIADVNDESDTDVELDDAADAAA